MQTKTPIQHTQDLLKAMTDAGYEPDDSDILPFTYDGGDVWVFVLAVQTGTGILNYEVSMFRKPTLAKAGEFYGEPLAEGVRTRSAATDIAMAAAKAHMMAFRHATNPNQ